MTRKRYTPEQIIRKLREAEVMIIQGKSISQATRQIGIVDQTYYKWRKNMVWLGESINYDGRLVDNGLSKGMGDKWIPFCAAVGG